MKTMILQRKLTIKSYNFIGSVAKSKKRDELKPFLLYLSENEETTARDCANHLGFSGGVRLKLVERMLQILLMYKLATLKDKKYALTEEGKLALKKERVFVPEDGTWTISVCNDPLLDHPLIRLLEDNNKKSLYEAKKELEERKNNNGAKENIIKAPKIVKELINKKLFPYTGGEEIIVEKMHDKIEILEIKIDAIIKWDIPKNSVALEIGRHSKVIEGPGLSQDQVLEILLDHNGWLDDWDRSQRKLRCRFDEVSNSGRKLMEDQFDFNAPQIIDEVIDLGVFDDIKLSIDVCPKTKDDADQWAKWRLDNEITNFATQENYDNWCEKSLKPFSEFDIGLPGRDEYAQECWAQRHNHPTDIKSMWHLVTAADWNL